MSERARTRERERERERGRETRTERRKERDRGEGRSIDTGKKESARNSTRVVGFLALSRVRRIDEFEPLDAASSGLECVVVASIAERDAARDRLARRFLHESSDPRRAVLVAAL